MVLKKPYAFFIKYFRLLHGILTFLTFLLFVCFASIYNFFRIYSIDFRGALFDYSASKYLDFFNYFQLFLVITLTLIIFVIMVYKDKPKNIYIYSLLVYVYTFIFFYVCSNTLNQLNNSYVLNIATSKAYRDFAFIGASLYLVCFIFMLIRTMGFDIKKFDFTSDLHELDVSDKDSEEIEVALEFDKNEFIRKLRKRIRDSKYYYFEHIFIINIVLSVSIVFICCLVFYFNSRYSVFYNQGQPFDVNNYSLNVQGAYVLDSDSDGNLIVDSEGDNSGVVMAIRFQVKGYLKKQNFNMGLVSLKIGDFSYRASSDLARNLYDIGEAYIGQELSSEYETYLIAFEIPLKFAKKKMLLCINDLNSFIGGVSGAKNYYVRLEIEDLRGDSEEVSNRLKENMNLSDSILSSANLRIDAFEINNKFQLNYKYCYRKDNCVDSAEYLVPTATGSYFKTLLKLTGDFSVDKNMNITQVYDLRSFLNSYGVIHYKVNGEWQKGRISSQVIKPISARTDDYYIEVPYEVKDSDELYLTFKIRNKNYKYVLK